MNHSINNLLWITLFAVLYISNVIGPPEDDNNCGENGHAESCSDCQSTGTCLALTNKGPDGCGCTWKDGSCSPTGCGPNGEHCAKPDHAESCTDCVDDATCLDAANLGPDGCRCKTLPFPDRCGDATCDPTIDPTSDPTVDPTIDPTIDPTQMPTASTSNPSITPTSNPSNTPTNNPSIPSITPTLSPTGDGDDDDDDDDSSSEDAATAELFEENKLGDNAIGSNNDGTTTSIISLHFSNEISMNIWILFSVLIIVNIIFCFICHRKKRGVAKIVEESSTMDNINI